MLRIKRSLFISGVVVSSLILGGCSLVAQPADVATENPVTVLTGKVMVAGSTITIVSGGKTTEITSRKVDLKQYNGKEVTVTGEFSGTTLFVDEAR